MGKPYSVDETLKEKTDDARYVFWTIEKHDYKAFRRAISNDKFAANPNLIYSGEGEHIDWKFSALIHCCYENQPKMAAALLNKYGDAIDIHHACANEHEWTALHWCVENGWKGSKEIADVLLKHGADFNSVYDNKGRSAMDLSEDRQYWDLNMKFILGNLTEGRQSIVMEEQRRHEEEDAVASFIANDLLKNHVNQKSVASFKKILFEICAECIKKKKPIDSTLYILAYTISNDYEKNEFCDLILNATDIMLDNEESTKLDTKWLKKYLLKCCIWQKKYYAPCEKEVEEEEDKENEELRKLRRENERLKKIIHDISDLSGAEEETSDATKTADGNNNNNNDDDEKKRLKKLISDIKRLTIYELADDDTIVDDVLNEIKEEESDKATTTKDKEPETQEEESTQIAGESDEDTKARMKAKNGAWDAFNAAFNKAPDYAKELKYFSHRLSREQNNDKSLILTLKEAQDTFRMKTEKNIDINLAMSKQQELEMEEKRKFDEKDKNRAVMYEKLLQVVTHKNYLEQQELKRNLEKYVKAENGIDLIRSIKEQKNKTRQDTFGLRPSETESVLQDLSNEEIGFDGTAFYTRQIYTQQLILLSKQLNEAFQNTISDIFENVNPAKDRVKVLSGPIKKSGRIIEKSETKYRRAPFPVAAKVLDTLRCSVVFKTPLDLHEGIDWFLKYVQDADKEDKKEDDSIGYFAGAKGQIESVVRSKNMFIDREVNWDVNNPSYADLKYNVVFAFNQKKIVCEIQFLIKEMMDTKKKIHGFYSILRYSDIFSGLQKNMKAITPERRFASLVRAKQNPDIAKITDLMITFGFNGSNTLIDVNWMRYGLHFSAEYKTHALTKLFLMSKEMNINIGDKFGQTPLNQAVWAGDIIGIKLLLADERIDVKQLNVDGQEPLGFQYGTSGHKNLEILKLLINAGCNPCVQETTKNDDIHEVNQKQYPGAGLMNVLHRLISVEKNDEYLENVKFICDIKDHFSYTKKELKQAFETKDAMKKTVLDWAQGNNNVKTIQFIEQFLKEQD